jgi:hypothetical protein
MVTRATVAQFILLAAVLPTSQSTAQVKMMEALSHPVGANGKPCTGIMFATSPLPSREQLQLQRHARELAEGAVQYAPLGYRDAATGTSFYVESDGQHLSAIGSDGKLLWTKSWNMCPYRVLIPHIVSVVHARQPKSGDFAATVFRKWQWLTNSPVIEIYFDSSQFGLVNQRTGDFFFEGQN